MSKRVERPAIRPTVRVVALWLLVAARIAVGVEAPKPPVAAIASAYPLASEAGFEILAAGGNAFDAAVAVSAALSVVEPRGSGLGGGGFYLLRRASDGHEVFVDAREVAPAAATRDMYLGPDGKPVAGLSTDTALAAGIPGEPAAFAHLAAKYGRLPLKLSMQPAIRLARQGFAVYPRLVEDITRKKPAIERSVDARRIFLHKGQVPGVGFIRRVRFRSSRRRAPRGSIGAPLRTSSSRESEVWAASGRARISPTTGSSSASRCAACIAEHAS
jgi:gamma-glutamyltranspeptidase/glutathione hydrolase